MAEGFPELTAGTDALMVGDFSRGVFIADKRFDIQRNDAVGFYKDVTAFRDLRTDVALAWLRCTESTSGEG